jgi:hypothetical protein
LFDHEFTKLLTEDGGTKFTAEQEAKLRNFAIIASEAKRYENSAKQRREECEAEITKIIKLGDNATQCTVTLSCGTKITVTGGLNYSCDASKVYDVYQQAKEDGLVPEGKELLPINQKPTYSVDPRGYEWLRRNSPHLFHRLSEHITVKPKKKSVKTKFPEI